METITEFGKGKIEKTIRVDVVRRGGEQLFKCDDTLFDFLQAYENFEGGQLTITRNNEVVDTTQSIRYAGLHGACTCFCGLKKLFGADNSRSGTISGLNPKDFREGDALLIKFLEHPNFNFVHFLKRDTDLASAIRTVFEKETRMNLDEFRRRVAEEVATDPEEFLGDAVLRFR